MVTVGLAKLTVEDEEARHGLAVVDEEGELNCRKGAISAVQGTMPARGEIDSRSTTRQTKHRILSREANGGTTVRNRNCIAVPKTAASSRKFHFAKDVVNTTMGGNGAIRRMRKGSTPPVIGVKTGRGAHP